MVLRYLFSSSPSSKLLPLATRSRLGARIILLPSATCTNKHNTYISRRADSAATMSTVAIPTPQHAHPHHHHIHSQPLQQDPTNTPSDGFDSETPSSSRESSRSGTSGRRAKNSKEIQQQSGSQQRMSSFFPLGYKEAAYQWVSPWLLYTFFTLTNLVDMKLMPPATVDQHLTARLRAERPQLRPLP